MARVRNLKDTAITDETDERGLPVLPKNGGAASSGNETSKAGGNRVQEHARPASSPPSDLSPAGRGGD